MSVSDLPALNATLNATAAILLTIGWVVIRSGRIAAHRLFMIAAFVTSSLLSSSRWRSSRSRAGCAASMTATGASQNGRCRSGCSCR
jgi:hypothetical protein